MKNTAFVLLILLTLAISLSSCNRACEHTLSEYKYDENCHWQEYTCGHIAPSNGSSHIDTDKNGACDVCEYKMRPPVSLGLEYTRNNSGTNYAVKSKGTCEDEEIVIPNTYEGLPVVAVLPEAFMGNTTVKSVYLPDSVILIYESAFMGCSSLERVEVGSGLKGIWDCAFGSCESLKEIALPNGLEYIYTHAFDGCSSLEEVVIPDSVTRIDPWAFANCTSLQSISFSDNITAIAESACYGCTSLKSIDFGSGVTHVRPDAFYGCTSLERLYVPRNVVALTRAFMGCGSLNWVEFEIKSDWKWASKHGFFNSKDVSNPEANADLMTGTWNGSSWMWEPASD